MPETDRKMKMRPSTNAAASAAWYVICAAGRGWAAEGGWEGLAEGDAVNECRGKRRPL